MAERPSPGARRKERSPPCGSPERTEITAILMSCSLTKPRALPQADIGSNWGLGILINKWQPRRRER